MDALLLYSRDIFDEFHQWGLIHEPFGFKSSDLTDCPEYTHTYKKGSKSSFRKKLGGRRLFFKLLCNFKIYITITVTNVFCGSMREMSTVDSLLQMHHDSKEIVLKFFI